MTEETYTSKVKNILESPIWLNTIEDTTPYTIQHDDTDGKDEGFLTVMFDRYGDAYISIDIRTQLRFRTLLGGGKNLRTRTALMILAEAIRLDTKKND